MKGKGWIFLWVFVVGLVVLLLPDSGNTLFSLNRDHGPSLQDAIGLGMMLIAWLYSLFMIIKNVPYLRKRLGHGRLIMFTSIYIFSLAGIAISLSATDNYFLWFFIIPATIVNLLFILYVFNKGAF